MTPPELRSSPLNAAQIFRTLRIGKQPSQTSQGANGSTFGSGTRSLTFGTHLPTSRCRLRTVKLGLHPRPLTSPISHSRGPSLSSHSSGRSVSASLRLRDLRRLQPASLPHSRANRWPRSSSLLKAKQAQTKLQYEQGQHCICAKPSRDWPQAAIPSGSASRRPRKRGPPAAAANASRSLQKKVLMRSCCV